MNEIFRKIRLFDLEQIQEYDRKKSIKWVGVKIFNIYRWDSEKQEKRGVVAHERLTEPRVTMEWLCANRNSLSDLPAFLGLYGIKTSSKHLFLSNVLIGNQKILALFNQM